MSNFLSIIPPVYKTSSPDLAPQFSVPIISHSGTALANPDSVLQDVLNDFMELGIGAWREARARLQELLSNTCDDLKENTDLRARWGTEKTHFLIVTAFGFT